MQARKCAGETATLDLKPMCALTQSPEQEQLLVPQNGPWSSKKICKNIYIFTNIYYIYYIYIYIKNIKYIK